MAAEKVYPLSYGKKDGIHKTEWCRHQDCPYGDDCNFAHHVWELLPRIENAKYKTENCVNPETCRFGKLCKFKHPGRDFCLWLVGNLYLLTDLATGGQILVQIEPRQPTKVDTCFSGLLSLAIESCLQ